MAVPNPRLQPGWLLLCVLLPACAASRQTPLELGLWPGEDYSGANEGLQLCGSSYQVSGLRLGFAANNASVQGLDLCLLGEAGDASGIALGLSHRAETMTGLSLALAADGGDVCGVQIAALPHYRTGIEGREQRVRGLSAGLITATDDLQGVQLGALWNNAGSVAGAQIGLVNVARDRVDGVQFGLINSNRGGLQIGLLCWNPHGFLPVFPFFNF